MKRIGNRILTGFDKTTDTKDYHRFIIENIENNLVLKFIDEYRDISFAEENMANIVFPMQYIPDFIEVITKAFFCNDYNEGYYEKNIGNINLYSSIEIEERGFVITKLRFGVENLDIKRNGLNMSTTVTLQWPNLTFPLEDLSKRIMPPSLAWLLDTLKSYYNEWQKDHPEHPPISD